MIDLYRQGMEKHLGVRIPFNIIRRPVQFTDDGPLLAHIGYLI
jgi:hypothetical protein